MDARKRKHRLGAVHKLALFVELHERSGLDRRLSLAFGLKAEKLSVRVQAELVSNEALRLRHEFLFL